MRDKIVRLCVTCKINYAASKNLQNFLLFVCQILQAKYKTPPNFMEFFHETLKTLQQQIKFRYGKFKMNHLKSFKKCSVTYKIL